MAFTLSEPRIVRRDPFTVAGVWAPYQGEDESPGWLAADAGFRALLPDVVHRADDMILGFLYAPHRDDPSIDPAVTACFIGVAVTSLVGQPPGLTTTRFPNGEYVLVDCIGDTDGDAAAGVGEALGMLMAWIPAHGYRYRENDVVFTAGSETAPKPPWIETVHVRLEPADDA